MKTDYPHLIFGVTEPNTSCLKLCRKQVNKHDSKVRPLELKVGSIHHVNSRMQISKLSL